jgi:hypothetical protein
VKTEKQQPIDTAIDTESSAFKARAEMRRSTWGDVTIYKTFDDIKAAEYAYWSTQPAHIKVAAISEMTTAAYAMKGIHVQRLHRPHRASE